MTEHRVPDFDFGDGFFGWRIGWHPDRELNPQYDGVPDQDFAVLFLRCPHGSEGACPLNRGIPGERDGWTVEQEDPLTLSPSVQITDECRCHGFIREGRWVSA